MHGTTVPLDAGRQQSVARLEALARLMDGAFVLPGTTIRFGLDGIAGAGIISCSRTPIITDRARPDARWIVIYFGSSPPFGGILRERCRRSSRTRRLGRWISQELLATAPGFNSTTGGGEGAEFGVCHAYHPWLQFLV